MYRRFLFGPPDQPGGITLVEAVICLLAVVVFVAAIKFLGYRADEALTFLGAAVMLAGMIATHRARR
jgi:hypothetical protein